MAVVPKKVTNDFQNGDDESNGRRTPESSLVSQMRSRFEAVKNSQENVVRNVVKPTQKIVKKTDEDLVEKTEKKMYKLRTLPQDLGPPPEKPIKPDILKTLTFPTQIPGQDLRITTPNIPAKRPPPKPPSDSRGKPLPPLPPVDDQFYDDNVSTVACCDDDDENAHSSPAALGIPYDEEELYQDADACREDNESIYETMEVEPCYKNNAEILENRQLNRKKDNWKNFKKEQRELDKKAKDRLKLLERFHLTGDEVPLETGILKKPVRGWNLDLSGKEGEKVSILRIKDNPVGKWLVANEKGKIGYVELTNIQVDPENIRLVMTRNLAVQRLSEEEEDIYQSISW